MTVGVHHQSLSSPHMRGSISHPILHDFEGIRSHNPTKFIFALVLTNEEILYLTNDCPLVPPLTNSIVQVRY